MRQWRWTDAVGGTSIFADGSTQVSMVSVCSPYAGAQVILRQDSFKPNIYYVVLDVKSTCRIDTFGLSCLASKNKDYTKFAIKAKSIDEAKKKVPALLKKALAYTILRHTRTYNTVSIKLFPKKRKM